MAKFAFEVVASGRLTIVVEAENAEEAEKLVDISPDMPAFDKLYNLDVTFTGQLIPQRRLPLLPFPDGEN